VNPMEWKASEPRSGMNDPGRRLERCSSLIDALSAQVAERDECIERIVGRIAENEHALSAVSARLDAAESTFIYHLARRYSIVRGQVLGGLSSSLGALLNAAERLPLATLASHGYHTVIPRHVREKLWAHRQGKPAGVVPARPAAPPAVLVRSSHPGPARAVATSGASARPPYSVAIVTRNAIHGGVETMVAMHQIHFGATVFVAGGANRPDTCPFTYTFIDASDPEFARKRLARYLEAFDVVLYHWVQNWAQAAIRDAGRPCIEVVHRDDTADIDKTLPTVLVTHSQFLAEFLCDTYQRSAIVIPHGIDLDRFVPAGNGRYVGAITSYTPSKGVDVLLDAWSRIQDGFPDVGLRAYGAGSELEGLKQQARRDGLKRVELLGPTVAPERHLAEFRLFVQPSRAEGMPFAIVEALACDVPVVASDLPAMVEFNAQARQRGYAEPLTLFRNGDGADLARAIVGCLNRGEASNTRAYVASAFSLSEHYERYVAAIEQALHAHAT